MGNQNCIGKCDIKTGTFKKGVEAVLNIKTNLNIATESKIQV